MAILGDDSLRAFDNPDDLFNKRDEIWTRIAALPRAWDDGRPDGRDALAVNIWCGEVKTHLQAEVDPQVQHMQGVTRPDARFDAA